jgi:uncharacterized membrane protein YozB (DUF420 family)
MSIPLFATFVPHPLVHVNASLNAVAAILLVVGFLLIKQRRIEAHKRVMMTAFVVSSAFLTCYLWYHFLVGRVEFTHPGPVKYIYKTILLSHILLAFTVPFLAIRQIYLGYRALGCCSAGLPDADRLASAGAFRDKHIRLARWTFPIWLYVSMTGIVVYVMLYHLWQPIGD